MGQSLRKNINVVKCLRTKVVYNVRVILYMDVIRNHKLKTHSVTLLSAHTLRARICLSCYTLFLLSMTFYIHPMLLGVRRINLRTPSKLVRKLAKDHGDTRS
jgi:hypothetical protein